MIFFFLSVKFHTDLAGCQSHGSCSPLKRWQKRTLELIANMLCVLAERPERFERISAPLVFSTGCPEILWFCKPAAAPPVQEAIFLTIIQRFDLEVSCQVQVVRSREISLTHSSTIKGREKKVLCSQHASKQNLFIHLLR